MSVGEICNRDVVTTGMETSITEASKLMRRHHVGCLIIVEGEEDSTKPLGVVTDRDLVVEVLARDLPLDGVVGDLTSPELLIARESDGIWETILRMRAMGVRRLPVVDDVDHYLTGVLSMDDLLEFLAGELSDLSKLIRREGLREAETRAD